MDPDYREYRKGLLESGTLHGSLPHYHVYPQKKYQYYASWQFPPYRVNRLIQYGETLARAGKTIPP